MIEILPQTPKLSFWFIPVFLQTTLGYVLQSSQPFHPHIFATEPVAMDELNNLTGTIFTNSFSEVGNLQLLTLSYSDVYDIEYGALCGSFKILDIDHATHFPKLGKRHFGRKCESLHTVHLVGDHVTFDNDAFTTLINLESFSISNGFVPKLSKDVLDLTTVPKLKILQIINCSLESIDLTELQSAKNLELVHLNHNKLTNIDGNFLGLNKLRDVDLSRNMLSTFPWGDFKGANNLRQLLLNHNKLRHVDIGIIRENFPRLRYLGLANNSIACEEIQQIEGELRKTMKEIDLLPNPNDC